MTEKEIKLVKKAKAKDESAFTEIYNMYHRNVRCAILQFYKQPDIVDELVNTVFLKVYKKLHLFVENDSLKSWLSTIATNTCIDRQRKKKLENTIRSIDDDDNCIQIESNAPNAEESIIKNEEVRNLRKYISKLSEKKRKVLTMFYFENLKYKEIAEALNLPLGTVQSDIYRAKLDLKQLLLTY